MQTNPGELQVSSGQTVDVTGLTFSGTGNVHVTSSGALTGTGSVPHLVVDSGTLTGGGTITVPAGSTAALTSALLDAGVTLKNLGTVNQTGPLNLNNGSKVDNRGNWNTPTTGGWYINTDGNVANLFTNTATGTVNVNPGAGNGTRSMCPWSITAPSRPPRVCCRSATG